VLGCFIEFESSVIAGNFLIRSLPVSAHKGRPSTMQFIIIRNYIQHGVIADNIKIFHCISKVSNFHD
jgi:hypothetical protein